GATVLGSRPTKSPSLSGYPASDAEVAQLSHELWGDNDGKTLNEHRFGKGRILSGRTLEQVFSNLNVGPDFEQLTKTAGDPLRWLHKRLDATEFYFIANSNAQPVQAECAFRSTGKIPELWHPDTGVIEKAAVGARKRGALLCRSSCKM